MVLRTAAQAQTLPAAVAVQAAARPDATALRHKRHGLWRVLAWRQLAARVDQLAQALEGRR